MSELELQVLQPQPEEWHGPRPEVGDPRVLGAAVKFLGSVFRSHVEFQKGAEQEIIDHRERGGSLQLLMGHPTRLAPGVLGDIVDEFEPFNHMVGNTIIIARKKLWELPILGYVLSKSGSRGIDRSTENPNETPEQRAARIANNKDILSDAGRVLSEGGNCAIWPDGASRVSLLDEAGHPVIDKKGKPKRVRRPLGELLTVQAGFASIIGDYMPPDDRPRVRMVAVSVHHDDRRFAALAPTVHITRPVEPVDGSVEDIRKQGEELMQFGLSEAIRLHAKRKSKN